MSKTGGGVGSNQYQTRGASSSTGRSGATLDAGRLLGKRRCGEVWGTSCQTWVQAPEWKHGRHPGEKTLEARLSARHVPPDILDIIASNRNQSTRSRVARHPDTPVETLIRLATDPEQGVRRAVAMNHHTPVDTLVQLADDPDVMSSLASNPNTPGDILLRIASSDSGHGYSLLHNPNTPPEALIAMIPHGTTSLRSMLAASEVAPAEALALLAEDKESLVRHGVARNPRTPPEVLAKLANDRDGVLVDAVALNPNTPVRVLVELVGRRSLLLGQAMDPRQSSAWRNTSLPESSRDQIGKWFDDATHPATSAEELDPLFDSPYRWVRCLAAVHPNAPAGRLADIVNNSGSHDAMVLCHVADNPNAPKDLLVRLATNGVGAVREAVAGNPNTPAEMLSRMSHNTTDTVLMHRLARNPSTPPEILVRLASRSRPEVRGSVVKNPSATPETLVAVVETGLIYDELLNDVVQHQNAVPEVLRAIMKKHPKSDVRRAIASSVHAPPDILQHLARSKDDSLRQAVAKNPNVPADVLLKLALDDPSNRVRASARENAPESLRAIIHLGDA